MGRVFRVLGALEVNGPAGTMDMSWPRERILLAMLCFSANRPVAVDRLVEAIWDQSPPETARGQIQICVSRLRRSLERVGLAGRIVTRAPGYLLRVGAGELDLDEFERLAASGLRAVKDGVRTESVVADLRGALGMFRDDPLTDIDSRLVQSVVAELTERRISVAEACIEVEISLGRHDEVLPEIMALAAQHPLRTRLRALQMMALRQAGRQAEALSTYQDVRRELNDELGIDPDARLRELQTQILSETASDDRDGPDSWLASPPTIPHQLPGRPVDLTGRTSPVKEIYRRLSARMPAESGGPPLLAAISGTGGVGKTTLALEAAYQLADSYPDGQLFAQLREADTRPVSPRRVLARFLRALGVSGGDIPETEAECAEMYQSRIATRRLLIVLDDAADERQVRSLLPNGSDCGVLITSRSRLGGLAGAYHVDLKPLGSKAALELLNHTMDRARLAAEPSHALELVRLCGGLPLALRVAAARLNSRPHWTISHLVARLRDERHRLDSLMYQGQDVRASIMVSYRGLGPEGRRLLKLLAGASVADFPDWFASALLDCDPDAGVDAFDELVDAQLVEAAWGPRGIRYRLHDLIRIFATERAAQEPEKDAERVLALRRVMATWLHLTDEAHRRQYGGQFTVIHSSTPRRPLPPDWVDRHLEQPLAWFDGERGNLMAAMAQAGAVGAHELCWDLAMGMMTMFEARGYYDDWRESVETALPTAVQAGDLRGEAAMLYSRGTLELFQNHIDEAAASLFTAHGAFEALGEEHGAALAKRNLAWIDMVRGDLAAAMDKYGEAVGTLRRVGDCAAVAHVQYSIGQILVELGRPEAARAYCRQALEIAQEIENQRIQAQVKVLLGTVELDLGDPAAAYEQFRQAQVLVRAERDQIGESYVLHGLGTVYLTQQRLDDAETALDQALNIAQRNSDQLLAARLFLAIGELNTLKGEHDAATSATWQALNVFAELGAERWRARAQRQIDGIAERRGLVL